MAKRRRPRRASRSGNSRKRNEPIASFLSMFETGQLIAALKKQAQAAGRRVGIGGGRRKATKAEAPAKRGRRKRRAAASAGSARRGRRRAASAGSARRGRRRTGRRSRR